MGTKEATEHNNEWEPEVGTRWDNRHNQARWNLDDTVMKEEYYKEIFLDYSCRNYIVKSKNSCDLIISNAVIGKNVKIIADGIKGLNGENGIVLENSSQIEFGLDPLQLNGLSWKIVARLKQSILD